MSVEFLPHIRPLDCDWRWFGRNTTTLIEVCAFDNWEFEKIIHKGQDRAQVLPRDEKKPRSGERGNFA